jgi:hypothetical protein
MKGFSTPRAVAGRYSGESTPKNRNDFVIDGGANARRAPTRANDDAQLYAFDRAHPETRQLTIQLKPHSGS